MDGLEVSNTCLAGIVLSRTMFLAAKLEGEVDHRPISPVLLTECDTKIVDVEDDSAERALEGLVEWLCRDRNPESICIGTYGAFSVESEPGTLRIEGISKGTSGPLVGCDLRALLVSSFHSYGAYPLVSIETDVGVYAVGENYVRGLPDTDGAKVLSRNDALAFGYFTGGVGSAISQNLRLIRGRFVGQRGKIPVYPHPLDIEIGFRSNHAFPFSLEAHTEISAIQRRVALMDGVEMSFEQLADSPEHQVWDVVAHYAAMFCFDVFVNYSPKIVVLGGRTMTGVDGMIERVQSKFSQIILDADSGSIGQMPRADDVSNFIVWPHSLETSLFGCLQIAKTNIFGRKE